MIKKTIKYTDFSGQDRVEDFYFNLTKAEVVEMELSAEGNSLHARMQEIVEAQSGKDIIAAIKSVIKSAYGVKSADGRRFIKSEEEFVKFESSGAYSELFLELATNAEAAAEFMNGLAPADLRAEAEKSNMSARERSEAQMQGFQKPKVTHDWSKQEAVPELPTVSPVLEDSPPLPTTGTDIEQLSTEQLEAILRQRQSGQNV